MKQHELEMTQRAQALVDSNNFEEALTLYETLLITYPNDSSLLLKVANILHFNLYDYQNAILVYQKIRGYDEAYATAMIGSCYGELADQEDDDKKETIAISYYKKARDLYLELTKTHQDPDAYYLLGLIFNLLNDVENAKINLIKAIELDDGMEYVDALNIVYQKPKNKNKI